MPSGYGHNSGARSRMYAIIFDLDTDTLKSTYPNDSHNNAYADIRHYLTKRGFSWVQGSGYFGDETIDAVRCVRVVQKLSKKYSWFKASVKDIRMLQILENNDLLPIVQDYDDDD